jgi:hypothetical protein
MKWHPLKQLDCPCICAATDLKGRWSAGGSGHELGGNDLGGHGVEGFVQGQWAGRSGRASGCSFCADRGRAVGIPVPPTLPTLTSGQTTLTSAPITAFSPEV